ncbi:palmitoyltransferase ZDHHC23 [Platysternon megacephalum]|uniref:Palmitoyltransferase ZDHHC23 n=1 Tax=Platysternon megacephalum TaxID=55544 RepID=A0A4D9EBU7_9SAUR|nr:palmitoyltransferase ZDHHC23 [Platysternon megacephalum]
MLGPDPGEGSLCPAQRTAELPKLGVEGFLDRSELKQRDCFQRCTCKGSSAPSDFRAPAGWAGDDHDATSPPGRALGVLGGSEPADTGNGRGPAPWEDTENQAPECLSPKFNLRPPPPF